jgi:hypothetical protein
MKRKKTTLLALLLVLSLLLGACAPQTDIESIPTVDIIGTTAAQLAELMLTQTAGAVTPTSMPPTETPTPQFTETPTLEPTSAVTAIPEVTNNTACYTGPGINYGLVSNIAETKQVEVVGISNTPGWYVIVNPIYGSLCWISADVMRFESDFDLSTLPTMYP